MANSRHNIQDLIYALCNISYLKYYSTSSSSYPTILNCKSDDNLSGQSLNTLQYQLVINAIK